MPRQFRTGGDSKRAKKIVEIFSEITTGSISTQFGTEQFWMNGIKFVQMKGSHRFFKGDNRTIVRLY